MLYRSVRNYGVNEVILSGITFRNRHLSKVRNLNNLLEMNEEGYDYTFIKNDNIYAKDLGKDNLHLNFVGTTKIVNNILDTLNGFTRLMYIINLYQTHGKFPHL